jgi:hypothetical protein
VLYEVAHGHNARLGIHDVCPAAGWRPGLVLESPAALVVCRCMVAQELSRDKALRHQSRSAAYSACSRDYSSSNKATAARQGPAAHE